MKTAALVVAGLLAPALLQAQLPAPSTRALGMGDAYTSLARGYEAVAWNPAMLAATGSPGLTIGLPHLGFEFGSSAYGFSDFRRYANSYLTDADKQVLLDKIGDSTVTVRTLFGVAPLGVSVGPFAFLVGSAGEMSLDVGKDAVRLALYGNAPRAGGSSFFTARGSSGRAWAASTIAASYARPFRLPVGRLSAGVTFKYVIGHFLGTAGDLGTQVGTDPLFAATVAGEAIYTNYGPDCGSVSPFGSGRCGGKAGSGYGVDLGATLQPARGGLTLSAVLVNALGSMSWDPDRLIYERTIQQSTQLPSGSVTDTAISDVSLKTPSAIDGDTQARALRDSLLAHADFARLARVGVAWRRGALTVAGDLQVRLAKGLDQQPGMLLAGGGEYRLLGIVGLRAGAGLDFAGATTLAGGLGLQFAGVNLDASVSNTTGTTRPGLRLGFGLGLMF